MQQFIHKFSGLVLLPLVLLLAISGTVLSVFPAMEALLQQSGGATTQQLSVAELAQSVKDAHPGVERIVRKASGEVIAYSYENGESGADIINAATGAIVAPYKPSQFPLWMTDLHRSLFLGDNGRMATGVGAAFMLLLCMSGAIMLARRMGGWSQIFTPIRGTMAQRLHLEIARIAVFGLTLSSLTGIYMTLVTFGLAPDGSGTEPLFPDVNGGTPAPIVSLEGLRNTQTGSLRELTFPYDGDTQDVFTLATADGTGYIDQATGALLSFAPHGNAQKLYEFIYMLHTGEGLAPLALLLGLMSLTVPVMGVTGVLIWIRRRKNNAKIPHNAKAELADTVILVGSEGNSTWGFARCLHDALISKGQAVHIAAMNDLADQYPRAKRLFLLTSTYGDGSAPKSASDFLKKLDRFAASNRPAVAVLGFGDRQFSNFCQFAHDTKKHLDRSGWPELAPLSTINCQSSQEFARWGEEMGMLLGHELKLEHVAARAKQYDLKLVSRIDYGAQVQAPTTIFRFELDSRSQSWLSRLYGNGLPGFDAGDLLCITPPGTTVPRYYSLASARKNNFVEICVRNMPGGLCSGYLHGLKPGDSIRARFQKNAAFQMSKGKSPVILIGAGAGIGPLAGFVRNNSNHRPMHLYFGGRHPRSDYLYREDLTRWMRQGLLQGVTAAFSRTGTRLYVQDRLRQDAEPLAELIRNGAQIMVCGGRDMAKGVEQALRDIIAPLQLDITTLKKEGRYVEDVF